MKKSQIYILSAVLVAILAIVVGLCLFFFSNPMITQIPNSLHIENINGDFYLVAQFNENYKYQFRLEQETEKDKFIVLDVVNSDINSINISESKLDIIAGNSYRFSVCYATDNGAGNGKFGKYLPWNPQLTLSSVQTESIDFDDNELLLSWANVAHATGYNVKIQSFDATTNAVDFFTPTNSLSLVDKISQLGVGRFKAYIFANSTDVNYLPSCASEEKEIILKAKNNIISINRLPDIKGIEIECSLNPKEFQIWSGNELKATLKPNDVKQLGSTYLMTFLDVDFVLNAIDEQIKFISVAEEYILESEPFVFNML